MLLRTQPGEKRAAGDGRARRALPGYGPPTPGGAGARLPAGAVRGCQGPWATQLPARGAGRCRCLCRCRLQLPPMAISPGSPASGLGDVAWPADGEAARPTPAVAFQGPASPAHGALSEPGPLPVACLQLLPGTPERARARARSNSRGGCREGAHARGRSRGWVRAGAAGDLRSQRRELRAGPESLRPDNANVRGRGV